MRAKSKIVFVLCLVAGMLLMFPAAALATNVTVDCSGQTPDAFVSLQEAKPEDARPISLSPSSELGYKRAPAKFAPA